MLVWNFLVTKAHLELPPAPTSRVQHYHSLISSAETEPWASSAVGKRSANLS